MIRTRLATAGFLCVLAAVTSGCATTVAPAPTTATQTGATSASPSESPVPISCESIIPQSVVDNFHAQHWSVQQDPFIVGTLTLPKGLQCTWGDATHPSDNVQVFGWAPITAAQEKQVTAQLVADGWRSFSDATGRYVTAPREMAMNTDSDGYGTTYRFDDGWVIMSDTKQGLLLIERPLNY